MNMKDDKNNERSEKDKKDLKEFGSRSRGWRPIAEPSITTPRKPPTHPASSASAESNDDN